MNYSRTLMVSLKVGVALWYWTREWNDVMEASPMPGHMQCCNDEEEEEGQEKAAPYIHRMIH